MRLKASLDFGDGKARAPLGANGGFKPVFSWSSNPDDHPSSDIPLLEFRQCPFNVIHLPHLDLALDEPSGSKIERFLGVSDCAYETANEFETFGDELGRMEPARGKGQCERRAPRWTCPKGARPIATTVPRTRA